MRGRSWEKTVEDASLLSKQVFDVPKAHREPMVQPDGVTDDFSWKAMPSMIVISSANCA